MLSQDPSAIEWIDGWLDRRWEAIRAEWLRTPEKVHHSHPLKLLRAHHRGLICLDRRYLDYPGNWSFTRFLIAHLDGNACRLCGARRDDGAVLHVHHIVFRSNSGGNNRRNLVTLCLACHQAQHDHPITSHGGETHGIDADASEELIDQAVRVELMPIMRAKSLVIGSKLSGVWWNPARAGEGLMVEIARSGNKTVLVVGWFTYLAGAQQWMIGNVDLAEGDRVAQLPLVRGKGAQFGAAFSSADVALEQWGEATLWFTSLDDLVVEYSGQMGEEGILTLRRLVGTRPDSSTNDG